MGMPPFIINIFVYKVNETIEGSVLIKTCKNQALESLVLLVSKQDTETEIEMLLWSQALSSLFKDDPDIERTLFDEEEIRELEAAKRVGFYGYHRYRCDEIKL